MFPEEGAASFSVACVAILIDAVLLQLSWARASVRIMAVAAGRSFPLSPACATNVELRVSLKVTLTTNFRLGPLGEKRRVLSDLGQLIAIRNFLHDRVASNATYTAARMCARIPVSLNSALMAGQARSDSADHTDSPAVFPKRDQPANAFTTARGDVVAAGPVAIFASLFLSFVARIKEKNFPHQGLGKFFKLRGVASLANFVANVSSRCGFRRFRRR